MWKLEYEALKLYHYLNGVYTTARVERLRHKARQRWQRRVRWAYGCSARGRQFAQLQI